MELLDDAGHHLSVDVVAGGVVGGTYPHHLRPLVAGLQHLTGCGLVVLVEIDCAVIDIVDVGTHLIHTVGGCNGHHVVHARVAEDAIDQVDGLIASVAKEDVLNRNILDRRNDLLEFLLQRVGIAVDAVVERILVGIKVGRGSDALEFVAGTTVGLELPDILPDQGL